MTDFFWLFPFLMKKDIFVEMKNCCTDIEGIFVEGDYRTKTIRQLATAVAALAAYSF